MNRHEAAPRRSTAWTGYSAWTGNRQRRASEGDPTARSRPSAVRMSGTGGGDHGFELVAVPPGRPRATRSSERFSSRVRGSTLALDGERTERRPRQQSSGWVRQTSSAPGRRGARDTRRAGAPARGGVACRDRDCRGQRNRRVDGAARTRPGRSCPAGSGSSSRGAPTRSGSRRSVDRATPGLRRHAAR